MNRNLLPCTLPRKDISAREHDYSIRLKKVTGLSQNKKNVLKSSALTCQQMYKINENCEYEITELYIEVRHNRRSPSIRCLPNYVKIVRFQPIAVNVVRVLAANGATTQLSTNMPLEDVCHTDEMLEITTVGRQHIHQDIQWA